MSKIELMLNINKLLDKAPYSLKFSEKNIIYKKIINELTAYHY